MDTLSDMRGKLGGLLIVALVGTTLALIADASAAQEESGDGSVVCPPVTLDDLFPPETTTTTVGGEERSSTTTSTAPGTTEATIPEDCIPFVYDMSWPLADDGRFLSGFAAPRDGGTRRHKGADIAAPKLTPVLAVASGRIGQVHHEVGTDDCCWLTVQHDDGWASWYIHLNNDTHDTDDGLGFGLRTDLEPGTRVAVGEVLGWLGDSGNAESSTVHLHFELRTPEGVAIDPWPSLQAAKNGGHPTADPPGPYLDSGDAGSAWLVSYFVTQGLHLACDDLGLSLCPNNSASPEFVAQIATHLAEEEAPEIEGRYKRAPTVFDSESGDPDTLSQLLGCAEEDECLEFGTPETEVARLALWVRLRLLLLNTNFQEDPENAAVIRVPSAFEAESRLRLLGALESCHDSLDGEHILSRAEALDRLAWWALGLSPDPCPVPQLNRR